MRSAIGWLSLPFLLTSAMVRADGPVAPAAEPPPLPAYRVSEPNGPWQDETWPLVLVLTLPTADLGQVEQAYHRMTGERGALLLVTPGGDLDGLERLLQVMRLDYPLKPQMVIAARDKMADWARDRALAWQDQVGGLLSIDAPVTELPKAPAGRVDFRAVLVVIDPARYEANERLMQKLLGIGVPCAFRQIQLFEVNRYVAAALDHLLPPPTPKTELYDPVTRSHLTCAPGWEFVRDDFLFAVARPAGDPDGPRIEVATGLLGKRSFEGYVAATYEALQADGIDLVESVRVTPPDSPSLAHAFYFIDHRGPTEQAVYWLQVGYGPRIVSFRSVGPREEVAERFDQIRQMALSVRFDDEPR